jgi:hypothetical protein
MALSGIQDHRQKSDALDLAAEAAFNAYYKLDGGQYEKP